MSYDVIRAEWRSGEFTVGFIAIRTHNPVNPEEWVAFVGTAGPLSGIDADSDAQYIAAKGAKLFANEARVFFPELPIEYYKKG